MRSLKFKNEEGIGEHKFEGIENDEGQSGTICKTNSGKGSATSGLGSSIVSSSTTNDISTEETIMGIKAINTIDDSTIGDNCESRTKELGGNMTYGFQKVRNICILKGCM
jgi:hypothetical protein